MNNVTPLHSQVNGSPPSTDAVIGFLKDQATKGDMGASVARIRETSVRQMAAQVAPGEPNDAQSVLDNIERLRERWARKNSDGKAGTAQTYASRAKTSIEEFFRWNAAPDKYDPKRAPMRVERKAADKSPAAPSQEQMAIPAPMPVPQPQVPTYVQGSPQRVSLGGGRELFYTPPSDGLQTRDVIRTAYNMITQCEDYDPTTMTPAQVFSGGIQRAQ